MKKLVAILIFLLLLDLFQYNFWYLWFNCFYHCEYVYKLIVWIIFLQVNNKWVKLVSKVGIIFCVNDIVDMIYFDPQKFQWNEVVFCLIAFTIFLYGTIRRKRVIS
jgi:uncharacterized membrane protein YecN with MAPEG domain